MSNAMRMGKRTLAGVAAGALGAALIPFVGISVAQAAVEVTPGGPLRAVTIANDGSVDDTTALDKLTTNGVGQSYNFSAAINSISIAAAPGITIPTGSVLTSDDTTPAMDFTVNGAALAGDDSFVIATDTSGDVILNGGATYVYAEGGAVVPSGEQLKTPLFVNIDDTDTISVWASQSGTFSMIINGSDSWTVTTTGAPASISVTPTTVTLPNVATTADEITVSALDASGNATQLVGSETLTVKDTDDSLTINGAAGTTGITITDDSLATGEYDVELGVAAGGISTSPVTVTVAAGALLPGLTSKTVSVNIVDTADANAIVPTVPANAFDLEDGDGSAGDPYDWQVPTGTTNYTVEATITPGETSDKVFFAAWLAACSARSTSNLIDTGVSTATSGKALFSTTISPSQATAGANVCVQGGGQYIQLAIANAAPYFAVVPDADVRATAIGGTTSFAIVAGTQYGAPLAGYTATLKTSTGSRNPSKTIEGTTDASGAVVLELPDTSTSATNLTDTVSITVKLGTSSAINIDQESATFAATVKYSASGDVALSQMKFDGTAVADYEGEPVVPFNGTADDSASADDTGVVAVSVVASVPGTPVTFSGDEGVLFGANSGAATTVAKGEATVTVASNGTTGIATAYVFSTKTGVRKVTATSSSGAALTGDIEYSSAPAAARDIAISADPLKVSTTQASSVKVRVTDVFGNPVVLTGAAGGPAVALQTDLGSLAGGVSIYSVTVTNANGEAAVSATSSIAGTATIKAAATGGQFKDKVGVPFAAAAASVYTGEVKVEFSSAPVDKSITIAGSRTTVKGKPGIMIDGITTGIENGKTVIPYFRFPGQTEYTQGSARPVVNEDEFTWQRKTGKKFYAYVTNDDGEVKSNRVIIQAR